MNEKEINLQVDAFEKYLREQDENRVINATITLQELNLFIKKITNKKIEMFAYTPSFNDGEECVQITDFNIDYKDADEADDEESYNTLYNHIHQLHELVFKTSNIVYKDNYILTFQNGVMEVNDYECGY